MCVGNIFSDALFGPNQSGIQTDSLKMFTVSLKFSSTQKFLSFFFSLFQTVIILFSTESLVCSLHGSHLSAFLLPLSSFWIEQSSFQVCDQPSPVSLTALFLVQIKFAFKFPWIQPGHILHEIYQQWEVVSRDPYEVPGFNPWQS